MIKNGLFIKYIGVILIGPLALFPACALLAIVSALFGYQPLKNYIDAILFSAAMVGGSLFYVYCALLVYGVPISILLKRFNIFNLPMVLLASVTPFIIIIPIGWDELIRPLFLICFGSIVVATGCWYTRLLLFKSKKLTNKLFELK